MTILDQLRAQLEQIAQLPPPIAPAPDDELGAGVKPAKRQHSRIIQGEYTEVESGDSLDQVRRDLQKTIDDYCDLLMPDHRLLCIVPPGVGKSHALVRAAIRAHLRGLRVAFVMPRHDFLIDLMQITIGLGHSPAIWYHWKSRRAADEINHATCNHAVKIQQWIKKGHEAIKFCQGVCGYQFINAGPDEGCVYHAQKDIALAPLESGLYPIVAIQHGHITTGHSLLGEFDLVIGDESPLGMYPYLWHIPNNEIVPHTLDPEDSAYPLLAVMAAESVTILEDKTLSGPALIDLLGGSERVIKAIRNSDIIHMETDIHYDYEADIAPYNHGIALLTMLAAEADRARSGAPYIERIIIRRDGLRLLLKRTTNHLLPPKVIWADATGDPALYEQMTDWRIKTFNANVKIEGAIHQVTDSTFTKTTMLQSIKRAADGVTTAKATEKCEKTLKIIQAIIERESYVDPLVISYSELGPYIQDWAKFAYFHGNRGTNIYQHCDAVFILGTPMPSVDQLEIMARMVYSQRWNPFNTEWCQKLIPYAGTNLYYEAGGLWADSHLEVILRQTREMEIVQSAHRIRPILSPKPIWLFTALPIAQLPPTRLISLSEALGLSMEGIDAGTFIKALGAANEKIDQQGYCTSEDLGEMLGVTSRTTIYKYLDALEEFDPLRFAPFKIRAVGRGGGKRAIQSIKDSSDDQR